MENEYGSYGCDKVYLANLRDFMKELVTLIFQKHRFVETQNLG